MSKRATVRAKQLEQEDPLVLNIAEEGNLELEYLAMMTAIENKLRARTCPKIANYANLVAVGIKYLWWN